MSTQATTDLLKLIQHAAGAIKVVSGDRDPSSLEAAEPARPYFRVSFLRLGGPTPVPGRMRGVAVVRCFAKDGVGAWATAEVLSEGLNLTREGVQRPAYPVPSKVIDYEPGDDGWQAGVDPAGGGLVFTSIVFHYPKSGA